MHFVKFATILCLPLFTVALPLYDASSSSSANADSRFQKRLATYLLSDGEVQKRLATYALSGGELEKRFATYILSDVELEKRFATYLVDLPTEVASRGMATDVIGVGRKA